MPAAGATTVGTLGSPWRGVVTAWGALDPGDGTERCDWWVGADDRWHVPAHEPSLRQRCLQGTPVVETRLRVPSGDAVQRIYAVADHGGLTIIELENRSPLPFAVAVSRRDLLSSRPPSAAVIDASPAPASAATYPVAHRTTLRLALAHASRRASGSLPAPVPTAEQVVRGWLVFAERAGRIVVPDESWLDAVVAARCALALDGPPDPGSDPVGYLLALPTPADPATVAAAAERVARRHRQASVLPWDVRPALEAAAAALACAGEYGAGRDVAAALSRLAPAGADSGIEVDPARVLARAQRVLARPIAGGADVLPGLREEWYGQSVEAHGLRVPAGTVGFAVRWHGARPALLWECDPPMRLTARALDPTWSVDATGRGQALLAAPSV